MIGFATRQLPSNIEQDAMFFYMGENATVPKYIGTWIDGNDYLLDISPNTCTSNRIAIVVNGGESLVFDDFGLHHFNAGCTSVSSVIISNFISQVAAVAEAPTNANESDKAAMFTPKTRATSSVNFTVTIRVDDVVQGQLQQPHLGFGQSPCYLLAKELSTDWGNFTFTCQYPGTNSNEQACVDSFQAWVRPSYSSQLLGRAIAVTTLGGNQPMGNFPRFIDRAGAPLARLLSNLSQPLLGGMGWLSAAQSAALKAAEFGSDAMCRLLHLEDQYEIVFSDPGLASPHTIGVYGSPPVPTIVGTVASRTTRMTRMPPRVVNPTVTDFPTVTGTSFSISLARNVTATLGTAGSMFFKSAAATCV